MTAMTRPTRRPTTTKQAESLQVGELTWEAVRWAAELYWAGLGGRVADQLIEWNDKLFDNAVRPAPIVLSRMSSIHGHWFPMLDPSANQATGYETSLLAAGGGHGYNMPPPLRSVSRTILLAGMMHRLRTQDGQGGFNHNSREWCELIMRTHRRLTGERIWASVERVEIEPAKELGQGLYKPEQHWLVQDLDPETRAPSLPTAKIANWPGSVMDLGHITAD